jgi:hypothetical protein
LFLGRNLAASPIQPHGLGDVTASAMWGLRARHPFSIEIGTTSLFLRRPACALLNTDSRPWFLPSGLLGCTCWLQIYVALSSETYQPATRIFTHAVRRHRQPKGGEFRRGELWAVVVDGPRLAFLGKRQTMRVACGQSSDEGHALGSRNYSLA